MCETHFIYFQIPFGIISSEVGLPQRLLRFHVEEKRKGEGEEEEGRREGEESGGERGERRGGEKRGEKKKKEKKNRSRIFLVET